MLSDRISKMFLQAERILQPELQFAAKLKAIQELHKRVKKLAVYQACLRCDKAGHVLFTNAQGQDLIQVKCGDFRSLPANSDGDGFGIGFNSGTVYFCDGESVESGGAGPASAVGDAELIQRWNARVEREREHIQPQIQSPRQDRER